MKGNIKVSMDINCVSLSGRLAKDPKEVNSKDGANRYASLVLTITNESLRGEEKFNIKVFVMDKKLAALLLKEAREGDEVALSGKLRYSQAPKAQSGEISIMCGIGNTLKILGATGSAVSYDTPIADDELPF